MKTFTGRQRRWFPVATAANVLKQCQRHYLQHLTNPHNTVDTMVVLHNCGCISQRDTTDANLSSLTCRIHNDSANPSLHIDAVT
jgi:hypothetical protein